MKPSDARGRQLRDIITTSTSRYKHESKAMAQILDKLKRMKPEYGNCHT